MIDADNISHIGQDEQKKVSQLSGILFKTVNDSSVDEIMKLIRDTMLYLELINDRANENKNRKKIFGVSRRYVAEQQDMYRDAEKRIDDLMDRFEDYQRVLLKNAEMYKMFDSLNHDYYKSLNRNIELLKKLKEEADPDDELCKPIEYRLENLLLSAEVSRQLSYQIHLLINNEKLLLDKMNDILVNTVALWKTQVMVALERKKGIIKNAEELDNKNRLLLLQFEEMLTAGNNERNIIQNS